MKYEEPTPDDYVNIAEKVRSGEYFREAKSMMDVSVNDPMSERYFYVFVTATALLTFLCALFAMQSLYPLSRSVPFIYALNDVLEDVPSITPLRHGPHHSVDDAVLSFMAGTFVQHYEGYNIATLERNYSGVENASSPEIFAIYQRLLQITNPESPVMKYQRHSVRNINIISTQLLEAPENTLEVVYHADVVNADGIKRTAYRATIGYLYSGVELDEKTGMVKPLSFTVTSYSSKIIQDAS